MFLQLENAFNPGRDPNSPDSIFRYSSSQLIGELEELWSCRYLGGPGYQGDVAAQLRGSATPGMFRSALTNDPYQWAFHETDLCHQYQSRQTSTGGVVWSHLIFAYLIEQSGLYELFARVIYEFESGRRRDVLRPAAQRWVRNASALFYTQPISYSVLSIASSLYPDVRVIRANDYAQMFGFPLAGSLYNGQPRPAVTVTDVNADFAYTLEQFLVEVWRGYVNRNNRTGANPTDPAAIAVLAQRLYDMLTTTRRYGNLDWHEFVHVSTMEYFYLTVLADYAIVQDLRAEASSGYERARNIAAAVGMQPHKHTEQLFRLADSLPTLLRLIESGLFNAPANAPALYLDLQDLGGVGTGNPLRDLVDQVIVGWTGATGRDLKNQVTVANELRASISIPAPRPSMAPGSALMAPVRS